MMETVVESWAEVELGRANLGDARLNRRLVQVAKRLGAQPGASIPVACGGWAETQAAYRLLANEAVDWEGVLAPHWDCSIERMHPHSVVLCIQDSTELDFTAQPGIAGLGPLSYLRQARIVCASHLGGDAGRDTARRIGCLDVDPRPRDVWGR